MQDDANIRYTGTVHLLYGVDSASGSESKKMWIQIRNFKIKIRIQNLGRYQNSSQLFLDVTFVTEKISYNVSVFRISSVFGKFGAKGGDPDLE